ncbi:hypothetical protein [Flavobacterium sp.]|uniref:hypothetical protein n=1 Tax=Flavobacterium sp. TaxID=239 RepID=UPI00286E8DC9|nr:hypothetical protein [Flavobacterium sp.]
MKKLELNQMENLEGGTMMRDCLLRGMGLAVCVGCGFWPGAVAIGATSGHCY